MDCLDKIAREVEESVIDYGYICKSLPVWQTITNLVDDCMVPSLSEPYDELTKPKSTLENEESLKRCVLKLTRLEEILLSILKNKEIQYPLNPEFLSSMILLVEEINLQGSWSYLFNNSHSDNIVSWFETHCMVYDNEEESYREVVFGICMRKVHASLTQSKWKHYPALLECYRSIITKMTKSNKVNCPLHIAFPATLMQLDDFHVENRIEGLKCCKVLLNNLNFSKTGYEDVVYETIMKLLLYKETAVLEKLLNCVLAVLPIYNNKDNAQWTKCDDMFEIILDGLYMESDLVRKNIYLKFLPDLINFVGNRAIRWKKKILNVLCDGIDIYLYSSQDHENINGCIKCLITWIKIGWPVWNHADHLVLVRLFKLLYLWCEDENIANNVDMDNLEKCIIVILCLYTESQRYEVFDQSEVNIDDLGIKFGKVWISIREKVMVESEASNVCETINMLNISEEKTVE